MQFADQKRFLLHAMIQEGYSKAEDFPENLTQGLPPELIEKWISKFYKTNRIGELPRSTRLVNRFMVGADPEFTFHDSVTNEFVYAETLKLQVGLAFGADLAGRPVELRPAPSRFVLDVVASILAELRWLALTVPDARPLSWVSKPFVGRDGIGGHIHFGRKRLALQENEVTGLNRLYNILTTNEIFNAQDVAARNRNTHYGRPGDVRAQRHGYEYRSMPTWLESPWLAYLSMVLAKLTVYNPDLIRGVKATGNGKRFIRNLLAYYKSMDDDALIAYNTLEVLGFPTQSGLDFKAAWGLGYAADIKTDVRLIPEVIEATETERQAIFEHFRTGRPIAADIPKANWGPTVLPDGYFPIHRWSRTVQCKGIGELIVGLATHESLPVMVEPGDNRYSFRVIGPVIYKFPSDAQMSKIFGAHITTNYQRSEGSGIRIAIGQDLRDSNESIALLRKLLLSGAFPIWKYEDVLPESISKFSSKGIKFEKAPVVKTLRGIEVIA